MSVRKRNSGRQFKISNPGFDMAVDARAPHLLLSGKNKVPALSEAHKVMRTGRVLKGDVGHAFTASPQAVASISPQEQKTLR
jgi:hypothetical protein